MKPARLLHVFSTFVPGGPQVRTARLAGALGNEFEHTVLPMDGRDSARELFAPEISLRVLPGPPKDGALRSVLRLRRLLREERPDALLTYNWGAIEAVLAARLGLGTPPVLHHEDGFLPDELSGFKRRRVLARRALLGGAHGVIVPSENLAGIARDLWKLSPERVHFIPNGVRLNEFAPEADSQVRGSVRDELGIAPDAFVVGSVGHLRGEKNFPRLVEACAESGVRGIELVLLGEGPERGAIEAARDAAGAKVRVHLLGHREDPRPYYAALDVFAMSSDTEQMPVALLEAMSSSLPVAATDVGDIARMLPDAQVRFVVACQTTPLAQALATLNSDANLRRELGRANRERVAERYTEDGMVDAYRALYRSACRRA